MKLFRSIRGKLLIFTFCISLIPIAVITTLYYLNARNTIKIQTLDWLTAVAESRKLHVLSYIEAKKRQTTDFSSDGFIRDTLERINRGESPEQDTITALNRHLLVNKKPLDPHLEGIEVVNKDGRIIASTHEAIIGKGMSDHDVAYMRTMDKNYTETCIGEGKYTPHLERNSICAAAPIFLHESAEPLDVVINHYNMAFLNVVTTNRAGMGETGEVYLVNRDGIMLTESRFVGGASLRQVVDTEPVRKITEDGQGMTGIYPDYRGVSIVGASIYLPEYGWTLLAEIDKAEAFAPVTRLRDIFIITGITAITVVVTIAILLSTKVTKPIRTLVEGTKKVAKGDLEFRIETRAKDEIGILTDRFNWMVEKLKTSYDAIKGYSDKLEVMVNERTKDLAATTQELEKKVEEIEHARKDWETTFDSISDLISIHDEEFNIIRYNKAVERKFNAKPEELIGKKYYEVFHGADKPIPNCPLVQSKRSLKPATAEIVDHHMRGAFLISGFPRFNKQGKFIGSVGISRDITNLKKFEKEKQDMQIKMMATSKLASLGEIATGVAHEINQPLTYISSFIQGLKIDLKEDTIDKDGLKKELEVSYKQVGRIDEIIRNLRTFGRSDDIVKQRVSIETVLNNTLLLMGERIRLRNIEVVKNIETDLPVVSISSNQFEQVFINLFQNAMDAFTDKAHNAEIRVDIFLSKDKESVIIKVADNGRGMEQKCMDKMFEPFFTTKEVGKGTGLGLSIVYGIIREHNCSVTCESEINKGTIFTITLPIENSENRDTSHL
ncbi:MAG: two-component sensor kinase [Candidatus Scalindua rubra]|uniref:histidine kinase n=1 Tax=Candidatus Scalindua rubra TaxID=1872076 RepID=A0A1E3XFA6_9BACT|nr:MAG: two-component sensor kinase [Candidatus Scalindua rubra]